VDGTSKYVLKLDRVFAERHLPGEQPAAVLAEKMAGPDG
jgi:hypothetical protein